MPHDPPPMWSPRAPLVPPPVANSKICDIPKLEFNWVDDARCGSGAGGSGVVTEAVKGVNPYSVVLKVWL